MFIVREIKAMKRVPRLDTGAVFSLSRGRFTQPVQIGACALTVWLWGPFGLYAQDKLDAEGNLQAPTDAFQTPGPSFVNTADLAVPGAEEVIVDVPSVFHWARYQRGEINGWRYVLYPDGSATVALVDNPLVQRFNLACRSGVSCQIARADGTGFNIPAEGSPKPNIPDMPDGDALAKYLAEWVLAGTGSPPVPPPSLTVAKPDVETLATKESDPIAQPFDAMNATTPQDVDATVSDIPETPQESGLTQAERPAPICSEPDPFLPSLCKEPTSDPAPDMPSLRDTSAQRTEPSGLAPRPSEAVTDQTPPTPKSLMDRIGLNCSLTGSTSLGFGASGSSSGEIGKPRVSFGCNTNITEKLSLRVSLLKYINVGEQSADDPDFTYAFTYKYSEKLTFNYSNYSAQFGGSNGGIWNALTDGSFRGSYKLPSLNLPNQKQAICSASLNLPNPIKDSLNISCGYAVTDKFRIGATLNLYAPNVQGDYDPDYTYTASYRISKDLLISYSNYSNNRWGWNRGKAPGPGLSGGSLSVSYALKF